MLLYDKGDPIRAVEILGPDIRSVHVKDANRTKVPGTWGEEVPLGQGQVNIKKFVQTLKKVGYQRPAVHRARGRQPGATLPRHRRWREKYVKECLAVAWAIKKSFEQGSERTWPVKPMLLTMMLHRNEAWAS